MGRAGGKSGKRAEGGTLGTPGGKQVVVSWKAAGGRTVVDGIGTSIGGFCLVESRLEDVVHRIFDGLLITISSEGRLSESLPVVVGCGVFALTLERKIRGATL